MTANRLNDYLTHMLQSATDACDFIEGMDLQDFLADKRTQQAVIMSLVIIGEASTKIMDTFPDYVELHNIIPWRSMRGMRNRIAHGYFEISLEVVWDTVQTALPLLITQLIELQKTLPQP